MYIIRLIAWRYLFSKKSVNAINLISGIAVIGITISTAALVIILSVFNGLTDFVIKSNNTLTADIKIEPKQGKLFDPIPIHQYLEQQKGVRYTSNVLEEKVLLKYRNYQYVALLKGVEPQYIQYKLPQRELYSGHHYLELEGENYAILGAMVKAQLRASTQDAFRSLSVYAPRKDIESSVNPMDEFMLKYLSVGGVLNNNQDYDNTIIVPFQFAQDLLDENTYCSSIEVVSTSEASAKALQDNLIKTFGTTLNIKDRMQQNEVVYRLFNSEKWSVYLILCFILVISVCNIIGAISMLIIDKHKDIAILSHLGASKNLIQRIFFTEGMLIIGIGTFFGFLFGYLIAFLQQQYGLVTLGSGVNILKAYPVKFLLVDFFRILLTIIVVSIPANWLASKLSIKNAHQII